MLSENDLKILARLRLNAKEKLNKIAKDIGIPVSTIYDKVRSQERKFIKRFCCLVDFSKLGYGHTAHIAIKAENKDACLAFLTSHHSINSLYKVDNEFDYLAEGVFKDYQDANRFLQQMKISVPIKNALMLNHVGELKKEALFTNGGLIK